MNHEDGFLRAVLEAPNDETLRLVYADWLEDHGNSDGAILVRCHCEMLKASKRYPALTRFFPQEMELRQKCGKRWLKNYEKACGELLLPISVSRSWFRIRQRIDEAIPFFDDSLRNGASLREIAAFETRLGQKLPEDFKHSYRVHNGEDTDLFFFGVEFETLEMVRRGWESWCEMLDEKDPAFDVQGMSFPAGAIRCQRRPKRWIPVLYEEWTMSHLAIDLVPGPRGHVGQVILFGLDREAHYVVDRNWATFLDKYASLLERIDFSDVSMEDVHTFSGDFTGDLLTAPEHPEEYFLDALRWLVQNGKW